MSTTTTTQTGSSINADASLAPQMSNNGDNQTQRKNNNRNSKNRNRNKNKNKSKLESRESQESKSSPESKNSQANLNNRKKPAPGNKSSKPKSKPKPNQKPILKEFKTLLSTIEPITINGISVKNLSCEPLLFLEKIINDKDNNDELFMTFFLKPSDPDFPFDLNLLTLTLCVPQSYPNKLSLPTIMVLNDDIPRGFSLNIEIGFKQIVATVLENRLKRKNSKHKEEKVPEDSKTNTIDKNKILNTDEIIADEEELKIDVVGGNDLLGMIKTLDKYLEKFLSMEKKDTIKLVKVINKKQENRSAQEKEKEIEREKQEKKSKTSEISPLDQEKYQKRNQELDRLRQRLKNNLITVFKDNAQSTTFKLCIFFKDDHLTLEFDECDEVVIEKLYIKLTVPKDYLNNPKKGLKLAIDMSNNYNIELVNSIEDTSVRLIFGKLINNIGKNFDFFAADIASIICSDPDISSLTYWTITSQLNFFINNIQKFMNEKNDFQDWYNANKQMNALLILENN
jgi:hypothetical protein